MEHLVRCYSHRSAAARWLRCLVRLLVRDMHTTHGCRAETDAERQRLHDHRRKESIRDLHHGRGTHIHRLAGWIQANAGLRCEQHAHLNYRQLRPTTLVRVHKWPAYGTISYDYFDRYQIEAWIDVASAMTRPTQPTGSISEVSWAIADAIGTFLYCIEILDTTIDERLAWAFVVHRDGYADVEEFFVRPAYRLRGYGSKLAFAVEGIAQKQNLPIRFLIPHADANSIHHPPAKRIFAKLGISVGPSSQRWASHMAMR